MMIIEDSITWWFYNESKPRSFELYNDYDRLRISRASWSSAYNTLFYEFDNLEINISISLKQFFMLKCPYIFRFSGDCVMFKNTSRELTIQSGIDTYSVINVEGPLLEVYRNEEKVGEIKGVTKLFDLYYELYLSKKLQHHETCYISVAVFSYFYCHMDDGKTPMYRNPRKRRYPIFVK